MDILSRVKNLLNRKEKINNSLGGFKPKTNHMNPESVKKAEQSFEKNLEISAKENCGKTELSSEKNLEISAKENCGKTELSFEERLEILAKEDCEKAEQSSEKNLEISAKKNREKAELSLEERLKISTKEDCERAVEFVKKGSLEGRVQGLSKKALRYGIKKLEGEELDEKQRIRYEELKNELASRDEYLEHMKDQDTFRILRDVARVPIPKIDKACREGTLDNLCAEVIESKKYEYFD